MFLSIIYVTSYVKVINILLTKVYNMRQKNSKTIFYVVAVLIIAVLGYVLTREVPMSVEHVEQPLENNFSND